jgi:DeoR/GlpR family transcriptional regulator of sugar metabolism
MKTNNRRYQIQQLLKEKQQISIHDVSDAFNISVATARRDLDKLAEDGIVERIHGGAQLIKKAPPEMPTILRNTEQAEEKARIAVHAVGLVQNNDTIFLGSGTTVMEVAKRIPALENLTVLTNSLLVANVLSNRDDINLIVLGGIFRHSENSMYGSLVEDALSEFHADKVIFGIRAIDIHQGLTNDFFPEISTDRNILRTGLEVIVVADHTKFNRISTARVCPLSWIHKIVTDQKTPPETINAIKQRGVDVIVAT